MEEEEREEHVMVNMDEDPLAGDGDPWGGDAEERNAKRTRRNPREENHSAEEKENIVFRKDFMKRVTKFSGEKGEQEFTVVVQHNSADHVFHMKTMKLERDEVVLKKPHRLVKGFWDERYASLHSYVEQQQQRLVNELPSELNEVEGNLFIDHRLAPIVKQNHEEVVQALDSLRLRLEKLKFSYDKLD